MTQKKEKKKKESCGDSRQKHISSFRLKSCMRIPNPHPKHAGLTNTSSSGITRVNTWMLFVQRELSQTRVG